MTLSENQVAEFRDRGVLVVEGVLSNADLEPVITELIDFVDRRARELFAEGRITDLFAQEPFDRRIGKLFAQSPRVVNRLHYMRMGGPAMFAFLRNRSLLDAVQCLIGAELMCSPIQHVRAKVPGRCARDGRGNEVIPWHQDAATTGEEADVSDIITCWIPLVDATRETGCMQVLPGAWRLGYLEHGVGTTIRPECLPDTQPVHAECRKGGVVFMHKLTPHCSTENLGERVRWSIDLRYQKTGTPTGRPFYPDFPVRSAKRPETVLTDYEEWRRRWRESMEAGKGRQLHRAPPEHASLLLTPAAATAPA